MAPQPLRHEISIDGQTWAVHGALPDLRPDGLVRWRYDDTRPGDYLEAWLLHLARAAGEGDITPTRWLSRDGDFQFGAVPDAPAVLADLLRLYARGLCEPVHFFPKSAWAYMVSGCKLSKASARWRSTPRNPFAEEADPAYSLALRGVAEPLDGDFHDCAVTVLGPLLASLDDPRVAP